MIRFLNAADGAIILEKKVVYEGKKKLNLFE